MTTPSPDPSQPTPESEPDRSWWSFRRRQEEAEPRLNPEDPSGFEWLNEPPASTGPAEPAEAAVPTGAVPPDGEAAGPPDSAADVAPSTPDAVPRDGADADVTPPGALATSSPDGGIAGRDDAGLLVLGTPATARPPEVSPTLDVPEAGMICTECGGSYGPDGYCENCGAKAIDPRHHYEVSAAPWLGGVCDRGVRHPGNQDALAIRGGRSDVIRRAAIVVCDGVSTAPHSAEASLRAAAAAADLLADSHARGMEGVPSALLGALGRRLEAAVDAAAAAVGEVSRERAGTADAESFAPTHGGPSCTFVAAVVEDDLAVVGNVGDSRAYWLPDAGEPVALTTDDSWASEQIRAGASREEAENSPQAHTITRWLGDDSPDHTPVLTPLPIDAPGWLVVCSDGLWNYASDPTALRDVVHAAARPADRPAPDATALAGALIDWAHAQGGHDNVTVGLARLEPRGVASQPDPEEE